MTASKPKSALRVIRKKDGHKINEPTTPTCDIPNTTKTFDFVKSEIPCNSKSIQDSPSRSFLPFFISVVIAVLGISGLIVGALSANDWLLLFSIIAIGASAAIFLASKSRTSTTKDPEHHSLNSCEKAKNTPEISLCDKVFLIVGSFLLYLALLSFILGGIRYLLKIENAFSTLGPLAFILFVIGMALINATATSNAVINLANGSNNSTCCTYDASDSSDSSDSVL